MKLNLHVFSGANTSTYLINYIIMKVDRAINVTLNNRILSMFKIPTKNMFNQTYRMMMTDLSPFDSIFFQYLPTQKL